MAKYLTKPELVATFRLDFLPKLKSMSDEFSDDDLEEGWVFFKTELHKSGDLSDQGLNWKLPKD